MNLNPASSLRKFLAKEFQQPYYLPFRNWYFSTYDSVQVENIMINRSETYLQID